MSAADTFFGRPFRPEASVPSSVLVSVRTPARRTEPARLPCGARGSRCRRGQTRAHTVAERVREAHHGVRPGLAWQKRPPIGATRCVLLAASRKAANNCLLAVTTSDR